MSTIIWHLVHYDDTTFFCIGVFLIVKYETNLFVNKSFHLKVFQFSNRSNCAWKDVMPAHCKIDTQCRQMPPLYLSLVYENWSHLYCFCDEAIIHWFLRILHRKDISCSLCRKKSWKILSISLLLRFSVIWPHSLSVPIISPVIPHFLLNNY